MVTLLNIYEITFETEKQSVFIVTENMHSALTLSKEFMQRKLKVREDEVPDISRIYMVANSNQVIVDI